MIEVKERIAPDGLPEAYVETRTQLSAIIHRADGKEEDLGVICRKAITTAAVAIIAEAFVSSTNLTLFKYHGVGTGTTAADPADNETYSGDLETTTSCPARVAGTNTRSAGTVSSVATVAFTGTLAITEHGIFNASTGVTLLDRHTFSAINVNNGDSIQFTYSLVFGAGG